MIIVVFRILQAGTSNLFLFWKDKLGGESIEGMSEWRQRLFIRVLILICEIVAGMERRIRYHDSPSRVSDALFFAFIAELELITPPTQGGLILPGITRDSILTLAREWAEFKVSRALGRLRYMRLQVTERFPTMSELMEAAKEGRVSLVYSTYHSHLAVLLCSKLRVDQLKIWIALLNDFQILEVFCSGTASVVMPCDRIVYKQKVNEIYFKTQISFLRFTQFDL